MGEAEQVRRNSFFALVSNITRMLATLLMFVGIARFFGPTAFGQFTLAHTYLTLFYIVGDFGIDIYLATMIAFRKGETATLIKRFFPLKLLFSLVALVGMCLLALLGNVGAGTRSIMLLLTLGIVGNSATTFVFAVLKGHEQFSSEAMTSFWQNVFLLIGLVVLALMKSAVAAVAILFVCSRLLGFLIVWQRAKAQLQLNSLSLSLESWKDSFKDVVPYGLHMLFGTLYLQLDTILLSVYRSDYEVGVYQAAVKIILFVIVIPDILSSAAIPTLSRYYHESEESWTRSARFLSKTMLFLGLPFAILFFLYPDQVLSLVYGSNEFKSAQTALRILSVVLISRVGLDVYAMFLTTTGRQNRRTGITVVATLFGLLFCLYAIPRQGINGAAFAALTVNVLAGILYLFSMDRKLLLRTRIGFRQAGIMVAGLLFSAGLSIAGVESLMTGTFVIVPLLLLLFWFVGYSDEERLMLLSIRGKP